MKYTVKWNQEVVSGDIWRMGEERELTTDQFYFMETTYPGCLVPVAPASLPGPEAPRAKTADKTRMVAKAPARNVPRRPASRPPAKKAGKS